MGRHKAADPNADQRCIKQGLPSIIRERYRDVIIAIISILSIKATKIACLASLLFLMKVNEAVDHFDDEFFVWDDGSSMIKRCFKAVLRDNIGKVFLMLPDFRQLVDAARIDWPTNGGFGNSFKYLYEQYEDNVRTNLKTHCESRLRKFFKLKTFQLNDNAIRYNYFNNLYGSPNELPYYDETDIKNAVNYAYHRKDNTSDDVERQLRLGELLDELRWLGAPEDCNIKEYVSENWFHSIRMWIHIQREIQWYHNEYKCRRDAPQIKNFVVVPMCSFQRRHIRIDTDALYTILASVKLVPLKCGLKKRKDKTTNSINITSNEFRRNKILSWNLFFNVEKVQQLVHFKKYFDFQICSDGVSVSMMYKKPKLPPLEISDAEIMKMYKGNKLKYAIGCDPGMKTWNASVRRDLDTKEEVNLRISSKRYHWDAKQGRRNAKAERITRLFTYDEKADRNRVAATLGTMPSPRETSWRSYIEHRLRVMNDGIETYTCKQYARLGLDKHIDSVRAIDKTACKLTRNQPSIFYMGASGSTPANSPIKIKKHVRCPGTRKLIAAIMKRGNCIVRMVDEYMTSQHCPLCFKRFPQETRRDRYKKCVGCVPNPIVGLPRTIVTNVSKRLLQMRRTIERMWREMRDIGDVIAATLRDGPNAGRLVSKKQRFFKTWLPNVANVEIEGAAGAQPTLTTVWHRDIAAAKLILYKGECVVFKRTIHPNVRRPRRVDNNQPLPLYRGQNQNVNNGHLQPQ
ncbi:uncharacterized protein LOC116349379 [Contarinia nasturtii]|uniref:uncharacterized protein LOC116349379 n=1 Tax=Contarinia nasturtii TaxID=265458 RepID=UPI0012D3CCFB|nr:uncharacterized protein LOC116349379 [Contarinia nasturtii]